MKPSSSEEKNPLEQRSKLRTKQSKSQILQFSWLRYGILIFNCPGGKTSKFWIFSPHHRQERLKNNRIDNILMELSALIFKLKSYTVDCEMEGRLDFVWSAARQDKTECQKKTRDSKKLHVSPLSVMKELTKKSARSGRVKGQTSISKYIYIYLAKRKWQRLKMEG